MYCYSLYDIENISQSVIRTCVHLVMTCHDIMSRQLLSKRHHSETGFCEVIKYQCLQVLTWDNVLICLTKAGANKRTGQEAGAVSDDADNGTDSFLSG